MLILAWYLFSLSFHLVFVLMSTINCLCVFFLERRWCLDSLHTQELLTNIFGWQWMLSHCIMCLLRQKSVGCEFLIGGSHQHVNIHTKTVTSKDTFNLGSGYKIASETRREARITFHYNLIFLNLQEKKRDKWVFVPMLLPAGCWEHHTDLAPGVSLDPWISDMATIVPVAWEEFCGVLHTNTTLHTPSWLSVFHAFQCFPA